MASTHRSPAYSQQKGQAARGRAQADGKPVFPRQRGQIGEAEHRHHRREDDPEPIRRVEDGQVADEAGQQGGGVTVSEEEPQAFAQEPQAFCPLPP